MPFFNVGDKVYNKEYPDKIYTIKERTDTTHYIPNYILIDEKGKELNNFCVGWVKWVTSDDALRYGEVLTDDEFECDILDYTGFQIAETNYYRIRTIRYEYRIFYHKMVNGEVDEFKELTI